MLLVTGGAGFIGSHTVRAALAQGWSVRVLDNLSTGHEANLAGVEVDLQVGSIEDPEAVAVAMAGVRAVVHLAAKISVPDSVARPSLYDRVNVGGFQQVLAAAAEAGVNRVVYASSCAVYGSLPGLPKRVGDPVAPESPYAANKLANELYGEVSARTLGLDTVGLRYFNVFGPRQDPSGPYGAVLPVFVSRAMQGQALTIHGDGEQGRDFVSVLDVAEANLRAAVADLPPVRPDQPAQRVFNVGAGRMTTINQLAAHVRAAVGDVPVVHGPARAGDVRLSCAEVERTAEVLGWRAEQPLDQALRATVDWFRDQG